CATQLSGTRYWYFDVW
nr:immunoglobulin heavy chain junction region [Mus musculus]